MANKVKYVECRHGALVRCRYKDNEGADKVIDFYPFVLDNYSGQPKHTGFTSVTEDQLKQLEAGSKVFISFCRQKLLIIREDLPASAQTPQALIQEKDKKIYELNKRAKELEEGKGGIGEAEVQERIEKAVSGAVNAAKAEAKAEAEKLEGEIEALKAGVGEADKRADEAEAKAAELEKLLEEATKTDNDDVKEEKPDEGGADETPHF